MEKFYVNLDNYNQVTPSNKERTVLLVISILFGMGFVFMLIIGISQEDIYLLFSLVNALLLLAVSVTGYLLYKGKNIFQLPLGTFFQIGEDRISYKFSIFSSSTSFSWDQIQKADMSMFVVHLWIKDELHEIDLQEVRNKTQQRIIKQKVREGLQAKGYLTNAA